MSETEYEGDYPTIESLLKRRIVYRNAYLFRNKYWEMIVNDAKTLNTPTNSSETLKLYIYQVKKGWTDFNIIEAYIYSFKQRSRKLDFLFEARLHTTDYPYYFVVSRCVFYLVMNIIFPELMKKQENSP